MTSDPTLTALHLAVLRHPADDALRLVYADRLEELREEARAAFVRVQVELAKLGECQRDFSSGGLSCQCRFCDGGGIALRRREQELRERNAPKWFALPDLDSCSVWDHEPTIRWFHEGDSRSFDYVIGGEATRGFVSSITLPTQTFLTHAAALGAACPLEGVTLTGELPRAHCRDGWLRNVTDDAWYVWFDGLDCDPVRVPASVFVADSDDAIEVALPVACVRHARRQAEQQRLVPAGLWEGVL